MLLIFIKILEQDAKKLRMPFFVYVYLGAGKFLVFTKKVP